MHNAQPEMVTDISYIQTGEGVVLLKNEDGLMPLGKDATFSFFGRSSTKLMGNIWYDLMIQMGMPPRWPTRAQR